MDANLNKVLNLSSRTQLSGTLYKFTNVLKGWQYRFFTVDTSAGILSYYLCEAGEETSRDSNHPRGQVELKGAVICPSDEDSKTFTVNCVNQDTLKLRAVDARARQEWVDGLRAIVESHAQAMSSTSLPAREHLAAYDALVACRHQLQQTEICNAELTKIIENSPPPLIHTDPDLLLLKALSTATTNNLIQCLGILQRHNELVDTRMDIY